MGYWFGDSSVNFQNTIVRNEYNVPRALWGVIVVFFYACTRLSEFDLFQIPYQTLLNYRHYVLLCALFTLLFFGHRFVIWNVRETQLNRAIVVAFYGLELGVMFGLLVSFFFVEEEVDKIDWIMQSAFIALIIFSMFDSRNRTDKRTDWMNKPLSIEAMHPIIAWTLAILSLGVFFLAYNPWMNAGGLLSSMSVARDSDMMIPTLVICLLTCALPVYMGIIYKELWVRLAYFAMFFAFLLISIDVMMRYV